MANESAGRFESVALTHVGLVRQHNEDSFLERPDIGLWAVADGMGGLAKGEVASATVVEALGAIGPADSARALLEAVRSRLDGANAALRAMAAETDPERGMGSTVAGLAIFGGDFACFWAGDSRVYRMRDGDMDRLTRDHSFVQDLIDSGHLNPAQAEKHPYASVIQRAVGVDDTLELDFVQSRCQAGDLFLLCSDGLTRMVHDPEIEAVLADNEPEAAARILLDMVLARGAKDNVTIILVRCL